MNKFIQNVRRIAKTEELLARLKNGQPKQDKAPIGASRGVGVGLYDPCQLLYSSIAGTYSFADLVDSKAGPKVTDGKRNHCEFVNTINNMKETADTSLSIVLKPDGMFLDSVDTGQKYYISDYVLHSNVNVTQPWFDPSTKFFYRTKEAAKTAGLAALAANSAFTILSSGSIELVAVPQAILDTYPAELIPGVITADTVLYKYSVTLDNPTVGAPDFINYDSIIEVTSNYNYLIYRDPPNDTLPHFATVHMANSGLPETIETFLMDEAYRPGNFFQLALLPPENLWKPNPAETTAPLKYKNGVSIVKMDFGTNFTRKGVVRPAKDGGFMLYETSGDVAINNIYIYRQDRTLAAVVPASQLNAYLA